MTTDIYSKLTEAKLRTVRDPYIQLGSYDLEITCVTDKHLRDPVGARAFIVTFKVLDNRGGPNHRAGETVSWYRALSGDYWQDEISAFFVAALGYDNRTQTDLIKSDVLPNLQALSTAAFNEGALNGQKIHVEAVPNKAKKLKAGETELKEYVKLIFSPYKQ